MCILRAVFLYCQATHGDDGDSVYVLSLTNHHNNVASSVIMHQEARSTLKRVAVTVSACFMRVRTSEAEHITGERPRACGTRNTVSTEVLKSARLLQDSLQLTCVSAFKRNGTGVKNR